MSLTVIIGLGERSGKTRCLYQSCMELSELGLRTLIMSPNDLKSFAEIYGVVNGKGATGVTVVQEVNRDKDIGEVIRRYIVLDHHDIILIDDVCGGMVGTPFLDKILYLKELSNELGKPLIATIQAPAEYTDNVSDLQDTLKSMEVASIICSKGTCGINLLER